MKIVFKFDPKPVDKKLIHNIEDYKDGIDVASLDKKSPIFEIMDKYNTWIKKDGTYSPFGKKMIIDWLESYNKDVLSPEKLKQQKKFLKDFYTKHEKMISDFHKNQKMEFIFIPVFQYNNISPSIKIHKSKTYNRSQSSEYKIFLVDDRPVYCRKSNHWGKFFTNIYAGSEDAKKLGLEKYDGDIYGRVGSKMHEWNLIKGGNTSARTSQAGYVFLDEFI